MRDYCTCHLFIGYWYLRYMYVATKFKRMMHIVFNAISVIVKMGWIRYKKIFAMLFKERVHKNGVQP